MASAASATLAALKAVPAAMQMMRTARSAMPAVRAQSPASMKALGQALSHSLQGALKGGAQKPGGETGKGGGKGGGLGGGLGSGHGGSPLSQMLSSLSRAAPHLSAMASKPGLGAALQHGLKAARELSKMGSHSRGASAKEGGKDGEKNTTGRKPTGLKFMVGPVHKNWEHATAEKGFREIGGGKQEGKSGQSARGFRVMVGPVQKNWEQATPENGFRELGRRGGEKGAQTERKGGFRIMVGRVQKNWESPDFEHGKAQGIHIRFARSGEGKGEATGRVGGLSAALQGFATATQSRQRANSFDGTQRKRGGGDFQAFDTHVASGARHRDNQSSTGRRAPGFSMSIGFNDKDISVSMRMHGGDHGGGDSSGAKRPRSKTF